MENQAQFESMLGTKSPKEIALHYDKKYRAKYKSAAFRLRRTFLLIFIFGVVMNILLVAAMKHDKPATLEAFSEQAPALELAQFTFTESSDNLDTLPAMLTPTSEQNELTKDSYVSLELPAEASGEFKTYMDYKKIKDQTSKQWHLQQLAYTNEKGFRMFNGQYLVAVGTYYAQEVGKELVITLDSGVTIEVIVGDIKMDKHTDENNQYVPINGNIIEFIVDTSVMNKEAKLLGNVSCLGLEGKIKSIEVRKYD